MATRKKKEDDSDNIITALKADISLHDQMIKDVQKLLLNKALTVDERNMYLKTLSMLSNRRSTLNRNAYAVQNGLAPDSENDSERISDLISDLMNK